MSVFKGLPQKNFEQGRGVYYGALHLVNGAFNMGCYLYYGALHLCKTKCAHLWGLVGKHTRGSAL